MSEGSHTSSSAASTFLQADSVFDALFRPLLQFANFADFQRGVPAVFQQRFGDSVRENRVKNFFAFAQDDWKISRKLTLNIGIRMEYAGGPYELKGIISNLNLNNTGNFAGAGPGPLVHSNRQAVVREQHELGPRFGFAWNPVRAAARDPAAATGFPMTSSS